MQHANAANTIAYDYGRGIYGPTAANQGAVARQVIGALASANADLKASAGYIHGAAALIERAGGAPDPNAERQVLPKRLIGRDCSPRHINCAIAAQIAAHSKSCDVGRRRKGQVCARANG